MGKNQHKSKTTTKSHVLGYEPWQIGQIAESEVRSQLLYKGHTVSEGPKACPGWDLVAVCGNGRSRAIQVKGSQTDNQWTISSRPEIDGDFVFILVRIPKEAKDHVPTKGWTPERPKFWILSSNEAHEAWEPSFHGGRIRETRVRKYKAREAWHRIFNESKPICLSKIPKQARQDEAGKLAYERVKDRAKKKDGSFRKNWDNSRLWASVNRERKKILRQG